MSKYTQTNTGRPYSEVRGYLRNDLAPADIVNGELTPESAVIAVYGLNAAGEWRYKGEGIVWSYDESLTISEGYYVRASLNDDDRFEVYWQSCAATALTVPDPPGS